MNKISVLIISALIMLSTGANAFAGPHRGSPEQIKQKMIEKLALSDSQVSQIEEIRQLAREQAKNHRDAIGDLRDDMQALDADSSDYLSQVDDIAQQIAPHKTALLSIRLQTKAKITQVLNADQRGKMAKFFDRMNQKKRKFWHDMTY